MPSVLTLLAWRVEYLPMAGWEEIINADRPENPDVTSIARATTLQLATEASLHEAYEPHFAAQETFWNVITAFLAKHGSLMYEEPNFDTVHFTTGPMALEQIECDELGNTLPVPSIQLSTSEDRIIWGYFGKRAWNPLARYFPPSEEKIRDVIRERCAEVARQDSPRFPYIEIRTQFVEYAGAYDGGVKGAARESGGLHGSHVPKALLNRTDLNILPNLPPPNLKHIFGFTHSMMRIGPPVQKTFAIPDYDPTYMTEVIYKRSLDAQAARLIDLRDGHIASMALITDIMNRADAIDLPLYDRFDRIASTADAP